MPTIIEPYVSRVAPQQPSAPRIQLDTSIGDSLQKVGAALTSVAGQIDNRQKQKDSQAAQLGLMDLNQRAEQKRIEAAREAPVNGDGYTKGFDETWLTPEVDKYISTLPNDLKEEYSTRAKMLHNQHRDAASNTEYEMGNKFSTDFIGTSKDSALRGIAENPVSMKDYVDEFNAMVDTQPNLTTAQREDMKSKFAQSAPAMLAETLKTQDPETLVYMLGGRKTEDKVKYLMPSLSGAVAHAETNSGANNKTSPKGARGLMQVMPETALEIAKKLGDSEFIHARGEDRAAMLSTDYYSTRYGNYYLEEGLTKYDGDVELALIRYNAGAGRVQEFLENGRRWDGKLGKWANETKPYVDKVFAQMGTKGLAGKPMQTASSGPAKLTGEKLPAVFKNGNGRQPVQSEGTDKELLDKWEHVQGSFGRQVPIVSAARDTERNAVAGGAKSSQHLHGKAIDLDVSGMSKEDRIRLLKTASAAGFTGIGVYNNSIHLDTGGRRSWGPSHHRESVPEWAEGTIKDHLAGGLGNTDPGTSSAPAASVTGSGEGGGQRGVASPPSPPVIQYTGPVSSEFAGMSGTALLSLRSEALTATKAKTEEQKQAEANQKTALIATAKSDSDSILTSGVGIIRPDEVSDFETNLLRSGGLDEVNRWRNARFVNSSIYEATKDMGSMSAGRIQGLIEIVKPTGGETASLQLEIEKGVVDKATAELEKRSKDPGAYVQNDPDVVDALKRVKPDQITTVEDYFARVKGAQQEIGLPFTPLSKDEAQKASQYISQTFINAELAGIDSNQASMQILKTFEAQYGGYADDVYVQALGETMDERISKDTKQVLGETFVQWVRSNPTVANPMNRLKDRVHNFQEMADIDKATEPLKEPEAPQGWLEYLGITGGRKAMWGDEGPIYDLWNTLGAPAAEAAGTMLENALDPGGALPADDPNAPPPPAPLPPEVGGETSNFQPGDPRGAAKPKFVMPGVKDYDLDLLGTNAGDKTMQENFRFEYGEEKLKEALTRFKVN